MAKERTLAIIKPDAVGRGLTGEILKRIHEAGFQIVATKHKKKGFSAQPPNREHLYRSPWGES